MKLLVICPSNSVDVDTTEILGLLAQQVQVWDSLKRLGVGEHLFFRPESWELRGPHRPP